MSAKAAAFTAALVLTVSLASPSRATEHVRIGVTNANSDITLFLADKKGYLREEGIDAEFLSFDSGAKMVAPMGAGHLDLGAGAASAGLFNALRQGIDIKVVADKATNTAEYSFKALLVRKSLVDSGKYKTLADLKGLKIAVVANGAADNSVLNEAVKAGGLTLNDVQRVYLGFSQQVLALDNGGVDAAIGAEPDVTLALRLGSTVRISGIDAFYPMHATAVILYGGDFIKKRPEIARKFMKAYLRAARDYDDTLKGGHIAGPGADYVIKVMADYTHAPDPTLFRDMIANWVNPDGKINVESLRKDLAYFKEQGEVKTNVTVEEALDTSFVDAALKELGPYQAKGK